jgi:hyperosmotically inducible periplasmic protein
MLNLRKMRQIGLVMAILLIMGLAACQTPAGRSAGGVVDDSTITTKVKAELFNDRLLSGFAISVDTFQGEVTLTGGVDSQQLKDRAGNITSSVRGVEKVNNLLKIK